MWDTLLLAHESMRPLELVVVLNTSSGLLLQKSRTDMFAAGLPVVVSRTWQVIGSLVGAAMIEMSFYDVNGGVRK